MEQSKQHTNILGTEKIGNLLIKFSIPGIASLLVNALYNIIDQIFIGQGVGYLGNGATNVIFPLTTFAMAFALLIGDGTASYMSLMLGKKEERKAAQGTAAGLISSIIIGIIIAAIYLIFLKPLCILFGATDAILPYAMDYGKIISLGIPFCAVCAGYSSIIRADGSPKYSMTGLLVGCVINLIGDPIFIFVFKMGVKGAALATIAGQIANAVINILYVTHMKSVKITRDDVKESASSISPVLKLGISSFISQIVLVIVIAVQNNILREYGALSKYGADIPISALGVTMKVFGILMVIVIGLAGGAQPIWGYNYGARQYGRVKKTLKIVMIISTIVMIFAFIIFQLVPMAIVSIFGASDPHYNDFAVKTLRIFLLLVPITGIQLTAGIFFQSVGKPVQASLISLSKQIIFSIPAVLILSKRLGVEGVLWSGPVSDALAFLMTVLLLVSSWKNIFSEKKVTAKALPEDEEEIKAVSKHLSPSKDLYLINDKPVIISIGRSYGAGGRSIGRKIAKEFNIPYYDEELIKEAAEESGLSAMFLAFADEQLASNELSSIQKAADEAQSAVIEKIAANGSCVIVGRRADQILKGKYPIIKIFVTMPIEGRIKNICDRDNITPVQAEKIIKATDKKRAEYYNFTAPGKWGKAENYDLCIDTSKLGIDGSVKLITEAIRKY
ncbi:MAG: MATE family efflux transporter [Treponema sp.]|nr:MATE family efflux transporter [Treponema sp.]